MKRRSSTAVDTSSTGFRICLGQRAVAAMLAISAMTLPAYASPLDAVTGVAVNVSVQQTPGTAVDWTGVDGGSVTAVGIALPPEGMGSRAMPLARRGAVMDAQRNLSEIINGVQIDSDSTMQDLVVTSDTVRSKVSALVKGAHIIEEGANADGSYFVKMRVPLYGVTGSVAAAALPELTSEVPVPVPDVTEPTLTNDEVEKIHSVSYTGVVIDASGLGLAPTFSPIIYDTNGRAVYGIKNIESSVAIARGMVGYASALADAASGSRAGDNPIVVKAAGVKGGKNSSNMVNVVVSVEDADRILLANEEVGFLTNGAVVFVK